MNQKKKKQIWMKFVEMHLKPVVDSVTLDRYIKSELFRDHSVKRFNRNEFARDRLGIERLMLKAREVLHVNGEGIDKRAAVV